MTIFDTSYQANYSKASQKVGASNTSRQGAQAAVQGAIAGGLTGGGLFGALAGGLVGGIVGSSIGGKMDKSVYYQKLAQEAQRQRALNVNYNQLLNVIREARQARGDTLSSGALTGTASSSKTYGTLGSIGSQSMYSVNFLAEDLYLQDLTKRYLAKAGKNLQVAAQQQQGFDLLKTGVKSYAKFKSKQSTTSSGTTSGTPKGMTSGTSSDSSASVGFTTFGTTAGTTSGTSSDSSAASGFTSFLLGLL